MLRHRQTFCARIIHGFLIAAFVLIGISPACKFIAGSAFAMEICKPDGTVVIMVMNEDGSVTETEKTNNHQQANEDCGFCFATQNIKILKTASLKPSLPNLTGQSGLIITSATIARQSANYLYAPRGPPSLNV